MSIWSGEARDDAWEVRAERRIQKRVRPRGSCPPDDFVHFRQRALLFRNQRNGTLKDYIYTIVEGKGITKKIALPAANVNGAAEVR